MDKMKQLRQHIESGESIYDKSKQNELTLADGEIFAQCYSDTPTRRDFPKGWFFSNKDNLINVRKSRPIWVKQQKRENGKAYYKFKIRQEDGSMKIKNIEVHNLKALTFGSDVFGFADELLERNGVYAFGIKRKGELKVNGHHINGDHNDNDVNNIQLVTTDVHIKVLHGIPEIDAPQEDQLDYMIKTAEIISEEEPNKVSIVFASDYYDTKTNTWKNDGKSYIQTVDRICFTPDALADLKKISTIIKILNESCK